MQPPLSLRYDEGVARDFFESLRRLLDVLAQRVRRLGRAGDVWVIFDNTAVGAATGNARGLLGR